MDIIFDLYPVLLGEDLVLSKSVINEICDMTVVSQRRKARNQKKHMARIYKIKVNLIYIFMLLFIFFVLLSLLVSYLPRHLSTRLSFFLSLEWYVHSNQTTNISFLACFIWTSIYLGAHCDLYGHPRSSRLSFLNSMFSLHPLIRCYSTILMRFAAVFTRDSWCL